MRKKQQTTEHEDSPDHIISYYITHMQHFCKQRKINSPKSWVEPFGYFCCCYLFSVWVVCVHFILFLKLFLCSISFKFMQSNIRGVNH